MKKHEDFINKVKKTDLSKFSNKKRVPTKVELNTFDEIDESLDLAHYLVEEAFVETMDKGDEAYMHGRDIMRFDFNDARGNAEYLLDEMKTTLDDLGVDYPSGMQDQLNRLKELEDLENRSRDRCGKWEPIY